MAVGPEPVSILQSIAFGIVQGLTEFLPISSTAHLRILPDLIGRRTDPGAAFTAVTQLGTVLAVWIYFWKDLIAAIKGWVRSFGGDRSTVEARMGWAVFWGTVPIIVLGFLLRHQIASEQMRSLYVIAAALIGMGIVMLIAEKLGSKSRRVKSITIKDGLIIGFWQCTALIPGVSRSGSTISGALFEGFDRPTAARVSFLMSVPAITAAGLFELVSERENILGENLMPAIVATICAFVVGYASIAWLISFLQKHGIGWFVGYRILLGLALIALVQAGVLKAQSEASEERATPEASTTSKRIQAWEAATRVAQPETYLENR